MIFHCLFLLLYYKFDIKEEIFIKYRLIIANIKENIFMIYFKKIKLYNIFSKRENKDYRDKIIEHLFSHYKIKCINKFNV